MSTDSPLHHPHHPRKSIDSVFDHLPEVHRPHSPKPVRPTAKPGPSWIGPPKPERPLTPGTHTMKRHVTVDYSSQGLKPPVYICTSLSDPQWEAVEMETERLTDGYRFHTTFAAEPGEYQYKFRLGPGDWWVCDEGKQTVDDGTGNRNNLLVVHPATPSAPPMSHSPAQKDERGTSQPQTEVTPKLPALQLPELGPSLPSVPTPRLTSTPESAPVMDYENFAPPSKPLASPAVSATPGPAPVMDHENVAPPSQSIAPSAALPALTPAPVMDHENLTPLGQSVAASAGTQAQLLGSGMDSDKVGSSHQTALDSTIASAPNHAPTMGHEKSALQGSSTEQTPEREDRDPFAAGETDATEDISMTHEFATPARVEQTHEEHHEADHASPLLSHEALSPTSAEQDHAPRFRHETIRLGYNHHEEIASSQSPVKVANNGSPPIPREASPEDHSLEKFPTDSAGIMEHIHRTSNKLPADEVHSEDDHAVDSPPSQAVSDSSRTMSPLQRVREADEVLERIREAEEEEYDLEQTNGEEVDPANAAQKRSNPMTPPLTPEEDQEPEDADFEPKRDENENERYIEVGKRVATEVVQRKQSLVDTVVGRLGGRKNVASLGMGLLAIAVGATFVWTAKHL